MKYLSERMDTLELHASVGVVILGAVMFLLAYSSSNTAALQDPEFAYRRILYLALGWFLSAFGCTFFTTATLLMGPKEKSGTICTWYVFLSLAFFILLLVIYGLTT